MVTCIDLMYNILQCFSFGWIIIYCVSKHSSFCWCNYIFHSSCLHHRMVVIKAPHAYRRLSEWNEDYLQSAYIWTLAAPRLSFHVWPRYTGGCPTCSANADGFNGFTVHLEHHDVAMIQCTRQLNQFTKNGIPLRKLNNSARVIIVGYRIRMKNDFPFHRLCI